jgi:hypothetical protein
MSIVAPSLTSVYRGWDGYQTSLVKAIAPLSSEQLAFRPAPHLHSAEEIAQHIIGGRLNWFVCMQAPGSAELARRVPNGSQTKTGIGLSLRIPSERTLRSWFDGWRLPGR